MKILLVKSGDTQWGGGRLVLVTRGGSSHTCSTPVTAALLQTIKYFLSLKYFLRIFIRREYYSQMLLNSNINCRILGCFTSHRMLCNKIKNSKNYRYDANQKPSFLQSVQPLNTNTLIH